MFDNKTEIRFFKSSNDCNECPEATLPEFAFIGRSNVGKSSLINMLTGVKKLAKTSSMPGKTQLINHFLVSPIVADVKKELQQKKPGKKIEKPLSKPGKGCWYIVDLPGYGWARTSKDKREHFEKLIKGYIVTRATLHCLFVLIDARLEPQNIDLEFIEFLGENQVPFALVFTKVDKISANQTESNMSKFKKELLQQWEELPPIFATSSVTKAGKELLAQFITKSLKRK